jgi:hypothetical protein
MWGGQHESWVERRIREAQERGEFDDLPGAGRPLHFRDDAGDENWWIRDLIEREGLDMTAALPPQLALRKEAETLPGRVMRERTEQGVRDLLEDFNARVRELWRRPVEGPLVVVRPVDVEGLVRRWRHARPQSAPVVPQAPAPRRRRKRRGVVGRAFARLHRSR